MGGQDRGTTSENGGMNKLIQKSKAFLTKDITSKRLLYIKAGIFASTGSLSGAIILAMQPSLLTGLLLFIAIWSFCRLYYFFFYVIDKYIDPDSRHASLSSFAQSYLKRPK